MKSETVKIVQGTPEWLDMIGRILTDAAEEAGLPLDMNLSFVERYVDGADIGDGRVQGIRLDIERGRPSYRIGAGRDEQGDIVVEVTARAARELNHLYSDDPAYAALFERYRVLGEWKVVKGDLAELGDWLASTHDRIVDRTR